MNYLQKVAIIEQYLFDHRKIFSRGDLARLLGVSEPRLSLALNLKKSEEILDKAIYKLCLVSKEDVR